MAALSGYVGNNFLGFIQTQTKVVRAMERREKFRDTFLKDPVPSMIKSANGKSIPTLKGTPDFPRLQRCFENIAHGLYYHHFKKPFDGRIFCIIDFVTYMDEMAERWKFVYRKAFELDEKEFKTEGNSPQIFKYFITKPDEDGAFAMRLTFYEGARVSVSFHSPIPGALETQFAESYNSGKTLIATLKDGSKYPLGKLEPKP